MLISLFIISFMPTTHNIRKKRTQHDSKTILKRSENDPKKRLNQWRCDKFSKWILKNRVSQGNSMHSINVSLYISRLYKIFCQLNNHFFFEFTLTFSRRKKHPFWRQRSILFLLFFFVCWKHRINRNLLFGKEFRNYKHMFNQINDLNQWLKSMT